MEDRKGFYRTAFLLWTAHFLVDVMIGFWPVYKTMAGLDLALAGLIGGLCAFFGEGTQLFFGGLSDRGYSKHLILFGLIVTLGSVFLPYASGYPVLAFCYLLTCIGSGAFHPSAASVIGSLSLERKGLWITFFASGGALGLAMSQIIFAKSYAILGGHTAWISLPALLLFLLGLRWSSPMAHSSAPRTKWSLAQMRALFQNRALLTLYCNQVCNQTVFWGLLFLLPDILLSRGCESWIVYGGGHLFLVLGGAFMMIPAGWLADRYSSKAVLVASSLVSSLLYVYFLLSPAMAPAGILGLLFLLGAALGLVSPVGIAYGHRLSPENSGLVSGMLMGMVWCISELVGPGAGGLFTKLFILDAPVKAALLMGLGLLGSLFFAFRLPAKVKEPPFQELATLGAR